MAPSSFPRRLQEALNAVQATSEDVLDEVAQCLEAALESAVKLAAGRQFEIELNAGEATPGDRWEPPEGPELQPTAHPDHFTWQEQDWRQYFGDTALTPQQIVAALPAVAARLRQQPIKSMVDVSRAVREREFDNRFLAEVALVGVLLTQRGIQLDVRILDISWE